MTIDTKNLLKSILANISDISYVKPEDIPNIDLYMDQVTTFMDSHLQSSKRYEDDKVLTKTMINNYAKNNLLPPPVKKKYSKEHVLVMIFIYYFKNILSIFPHSSRFNKNLPAFKGKAVAAYAVLRDMLPNQGGIIFLFNLGKGGIRCLRQA